MLRRTPHRPRSGPRPRPARPGRTAPLLAALVALASLGVAAPAGAAHDGGRDQATPEPVPADPPAVHAPHAEEPPPVGPLPDLHPAIAEVAVTSPTYDAVAGHRDEVAADLDDARALHADQESRMADLLVREADLTAQIEESVSRAERWEADARRLDRQARAVAIDSFVRGTSGADFGPLLEIDIETAEAEAQAQVVSGTLTTRQLRELRHAQEQAQRHRNDEALGRAVRAGVREAHAEAEGIRDRAADDIERLSVELLEATSSAADERRLAKVVGAEFPLVVLDAYVKAAEAMTIEAPGCGIPWWALAGIGRIESGHGTHAGSEVRADGSLTKPIIGIPLNGSNNTAVIGDSDGGLIDGDPTVDRAAGPMQFIPTTWARWGRDGDGNGVIDIQGYYDAAAAAAAYLCASGPMTDDAGLSRGYFSYNHSALYVLAVLDQAHRYRDEVVIPPA